MLESVPDVTAIGFYAASYGSDGDAVLSVSYSSDQGSSWYGLGTVTVSRGNLQHYVLEVDSDWPLRFGISQVSGSRVNIDNITIYRRSNKLKGDVNGDGEVNIADVNIVIGHILSGEIDNDCDVNEDQEVNIADANFIIGLILNF
jgi:hypothetical protein